MHVELLGIRAYASDESKQGRGAYDSSKYAPVEIQI